MAVEAYLAIGLLAGFILLGSVAAPRICSLFVSAEKKYEPRIRTF